MRSKLWICALVMSGCGFTNDPSTGGQTGEETIGCLPQSKQTLTIEEVSVLGFSAQDVVTRDATTSSQTLTWDDDTTTELTVGLEELGSYEFVDYEWIDDSDAMQVGNLAEPDCPDRVEVAVEVTLSTADGKLAETFEQRLRARSENDAELWWGFDAKELSGSFDFSAYANDLEKVQPSIEMRFTDSIAGSFSAVIEDESSDNSPDGAVSATSFEFATWGIASE